MKKINHTKEQARVFLVQNALDEINMITDFSKFYRNVFSIIAKYGLQLETKEEELFSGDEWSNYTYRDFLI